MTDALRLASANSLQTLGSTKGAVWRTPVRHVARFFR